MEIPLYVLYPSIVVISILILSPRIHTGLICTVGLSIIALGLLGLVLQENELGSTPRFGIDGQWQAIKIGLIISILGVGFNLLRKKPKPPTRPRELKPHELHQVSGRGE